MNYEEQKHRFYNDPEFSALVMSLYSVFLSGKFSVSEIKDAVTFAAIKFEHENVRPIYPHKETPDGKDKT